MKRFIILYLLALAQIGNAQSFLMVDNMIITYASQANMSLQYYFTEENEYTGYQFEIVLPEGITCITDEKGKIVYSLGDCYEDTHNISMNYDEENRLLKVACLSLESDPISSTSGTLLLIPLQADASLDVDNKVNVLIRNITLATLDAQSVPLSDVLFTITIAEPDDGRIKFNENSTTLPTYTAGEKGDVSIVRTIKANEWSTIVLPFTLTKAKAEAVFGEDVQLAEFSGFEATYSDEDDLSPDAIYINMSTYTMTAKKGMTGGKPYLIKTSKNIDGFEADNVTLFREVTNISKTDEYDTPGVLTGTLIKSKIPTDGLFISNNLFWYSTGLTNVKAFRAWFELGTVLNKDTNFEARVFLNIIDEDVTDINTIRKENNEKVYDLQGRQIAKPTRGLYIQNGKKIIK